MKDVNADEYNPYVHSEMLKGEINLLQAESQHLNRSRQNAKDSIIEKRKQEKEEIEFIKEVKKVMDGEMKNPADMTRLYKKGLSVNNFKIF